MELLSLHFHVILSGELSHVAVVFQFPEATGAKIHWVGIWSCFVVDCQHMKPFPTGIRISLKCPAKLNGILIIRIGIQRQTIQIIDLILRTIGTVCTRWIHHCKVPLFPTRGIEIQSGFLWLRIDYFISYETLMFWYPVVFKASTSWSVPEELLLLVWIYNCPLLTFTPPVPIPEYPYPVPLLFTTVAESKDDSLLFEYCLMSQQGCTRTTWLHAIRQNPQESPWILKPTVQNPVRGICCGVGFVWANALSTLRIPEIIQMKITIRFNGFLLPENPVMHSTTRMLEQNSFRWENSNN